MNLFIDIKLKQYLKPIFNFIDCYEYEFSEKCTYIIHESSNKPNNCNIVKSNIKKRLGVLKELWSIFIKLNIIVKVHTIDIFTDGSAINAGKESALACGGFYLESFVDLKLDVFIYNINIFSELYYTSKKLTNFEYKLEEQAIINTEKPANQTNNRGELIGVCLGLLHIKLLKEIFGKLECAFKIISDSNYSIKTITEYYPKRLLKKTENELLNCDLLYIAHNLNNSIMWEHIRSHKDKPKCKCNNNDCICENIRKWNGNRIVDEIVKI